MKIGKYKNRLISLYVCILGILLLGLFSCNDNLEDTLRYDYPESGSNYNTGHVLLIVVDGMSGVTLQTARNAYKAPTLKSMLSHALYTDYGLSDNSNEVAGGKMTNERGWANLMIGTTTHGISTSEDLDTYEQPTLLENLLGAHTNISMYASDNYFREKFAVNGMTAPIVETDEAVKNGVLMELNNSLSMPADLIVAEFKGVNDAGKANDGIFYDENGVPVESVVDAVGTLDGYIGEMLMALQARPNYPHENWLIIVTSNYGGKSAKEEVVNDHYGDISRNTFTLMYNRNFKSQLQGIPTSATIAYNYYTPVWGYDCNNDNADLYAESAKVQDLKLGRFAVNTPMTIQFFMKSSAATSQKYVILSKSADITANGWCLYFNDSNKRICLTIGTKRGALQFADYKNIDWSAWHTVTITFEPDPKTKNYTQITMYLDGEQNSQGKQKDSDLTKWYTGSKGSADNTPLRIGGTESREAQNEQNNTKGQAYKNSLCITNLQLYDIALSPEDVAKYAGKNMLHRLKNSYPYWDNLVGYWPCDLEEDEGDKILKDYSQYKAEDGSSHFEIDRGATDVWTSGFSSDNAMHPIPESDALFYNKTINTVDIFKQIYLWLGKGSNIGWGLEGKAWHLPYENTMIE